MHAVSVIVVLECVALPFQIIRIPEQGVIEILTPDGSDQPLYKDGMNASLSDAKVARAQ